MHCRNRLILLALVLLVLTTQTPPPVATKAELGSCPDFRGRRPKVGRETIAAKKANAPLVHTVNRPVLVPRRSPQRQSAATAGNSMTVAPQERAMKTPSQKRPSVVAEAKKPAPAPPPANAGIAWSDSYAKAMSAAERQNKMLFIYFCDCGGEGPCNRFKAETLEAPQVRNKLRQYVCVQVALDASIIVGGKPVKLLDHPSFREMLGRPGIAIVDFRSTDATLRGSVASVFPITESLWYTPERMAVILDLPPGTLTQRTLIYAVRTHPEKPASTDSELNADLAVEAQSHSEYQASIRRQGHQFWESRFHRIVSRLGGVPAREVCAESWPGQNLVEAAIECVRCWRLSSGHWSAVRASNRCFAYDMHRGANGVWYATGIFGTR